MQRKGCRQGGIDSRLAPDLDPASNSQSIGDAGKAMGRQFNIAAPFDLRPHLVPERQASDFLGSCFCGRVVAIGEAKPCASLRQVVPMMPPGTLQRFVVRIRQPVTGEVPGIAVCPVRRIAQPTEQTPDVSPIHMVERILHCMNCRSVEQT